MTNRMGAFYFKTPRTIRMAEDFRDLTAFKKDSTILDFEVKGEPPSEYIITYNGNSLIPLKAGGAKVGGPQKVKLTLGPQYPVERPHIEWLTPIAHPNISGHSVCLGNYNSAWTPHFRLVDLVEILWDYARMAILNAEGGYNRGSRDWDDMRRHFKFPVDPRPLRDKVFGNNEGSSILRPTGAEDEITFVDDDEGACER